MPRVFHADGPGEIETPDAGIVVPLSDGQGIIFVDPTFIGTPERHAERHDELGARFLGNLKGFDALVDGFVPLHVLIFGEVCFRYGDKAEHLVAVGLGRPFRATGIWHQSAINGSRTPFDSCHYLFGIT